LTLSETFIRATSGLNVLKTQRMTSTIDSHRLTPNSLKLPHVAGWLLCLACCAGCGTTREKQATEQLLLSDAVDRAVAQIDFSPLAGETVYLDTTYLRSVKGNLFVNSDYIVSSLRQQMVLAGCLLQDTRDDADFIAEARVGVLGTDGHDINYGVPSSQGFNAAAGLISGAGNVPSLPDVSLARKTDDSAASKVAVFAYHRETREPVWQSGLSVARSTARAKWILGAGPFQSGSIYDGTQFAGNRLNASPIRRRDKEDQEMLGPQDTAYRSPAVWHPELQDKLYDQLFPQYVQQNEPASESEGEGQNDNEPSAEESTSGVQPVEYQEEVEP